MWVAFAGSAVNKQRMTKRHLGGNPITLKGMCALRVATRVCRSVTSGALYQVRTPHTLEFMTALCEHHRSALPDPLSSKEYAELSKTHHVTHSLSTDSNGGAALEFS